MKPFTVKVPERWPPLSSAQAGEWLRSYFVHPLSLPPDPGAGERILRLSLSERLVVALSEGAAERPAVALRRLLAAHLHELSARAEPRALLPAKVGAGARSLPMEMPPAWWEPQADSYWRSAVWAGLPADYKAELLGQAVPALAKSGAPARVPSNGISWRSLLLPVLPLVAYVLILHFAAARQSSANPSAPAAQFGAWRPE